MLQGLNQFLLQRINYSFNQIFHLPVLITYVY